MRALLVPLLVTLMGGAASAKEYALILSDAERQALVVIIDAAVKAQGIQIMDSAAALLGKVRAANEVVPHVDNSPEPQPSPSPYPSPRTGRPSLEGGL